MKHSLNSGISRLPDSPRDSAIRGTKPSGRRRRMSAVERRRHLIAAALRLFATRGFSGTTTRAIAEAGGVSEAIIFRHFSGKEALYDAILREKARQDDYSQLIQVLSDFARRRDDEHLVFHLVLRTLESFRRDPDFHRLMLYAALERPDLAKTGRRIFRMPLFKLLRNYIVRRQKEGAFRQEQPELFAFGIMALPMHFGMVTEVIGVKKVSTSSHDLATRFTRIILDGMRIPGIAADTAGSTKEKAARTREDSCL
jgi:AcrR family transcriptional regulator